MDLFSPAVGRWFADSFPGPTRVQELGWPVLTRGRNALLVAPTGSGKTLAAFLWAIDRLSFDRAHGGVDRVHGDVSGDSDNGGPAAAREPGAARCAPPANQSERPSSGARMEPGVRVLYVSPLKALVYDINRNLEAPLVGVRRSARKLGVPVRPVTVDVRTGDTTPGERRRQLRRPGEILVTTPESLFLILGSQAAANLRTVETVIVDEVHAMAATKRGAHLALSLERLAELVGGEGPQRIGLSATVRPPGAAAEFLGGDRPVEVVDASEPPNIDLQVVVPVVDMEAPPPPEGLEDGGDWPRGAEISGLWPSIYPASWRRSRGAVRRSSSSTAALGASVSRSGSTAWQSASRSGAECQGGGGWGQTPSLRGVWRRWRRSLSPQRPGRTPRPAAAAVVSGWPRPKKPSRWRGPTMAVSPTSSGERSRRR